MIICVTGTYGTTSLVHRILYDTFSILHTPTLLTTIYKVNDFTVIDSPPQHPPRRCHMLILTCRKQRDVEDIARKWLGYHNILVVALVNTNAEQPSLCPKPHLVQVDNMSKEGIHDILRLIHINKNHSL